MASKPRFTPAELGQLRDACTEKQFAALALWNSGYGYRRIGLYLGIHPSSAKDRIESGLRRACIDRESLLGSFDS